MMRVEQAAMATVDERVEPMTIKHIGHGIDGLIVNAAGVLIVTSHRVPHRRPADDDEGQIGMHLLHERHHGGWRARRCDGEKPAQFLNDAVEHGHGANRQHRVLVEQGPVQVTHIERPAQLICRLFNHGCKGSKKAANAAF